MHGALQLRTCGVSRDRPLQLPFKWTLTWLVHFDVRLFGLSRTSYFIHRHGHLLR